MQINVSTRRNRAFRPRSAIALSLVLPEDAGQIVVTGSHGGLIGGDAAAALRVQAFAAIFNDAGIGADKAGIRRLPALDARGIAVFTVAASTASIGSARSTYEDGTISAVNEAVRRRGRHASETRSRRVEPRSG